MAKLPALAATVLAFLLAPEAANAITIYGTFEGVIASFERELDGVFTPGDPILGTFQVESDAVDMDADTNQGMYAGYGAIQAGDFSSGTLEIEIHVDAQRGPSGFDVFGVRWVGDEPINGVSLTLWEFALRDETDSVFADESVPSRDLSLDDFTHTYWAQLWVNDYVVAVDFTAFTLVPEPTARLLLVTGLLGLGVAGRRRNRLGELPR